MSEPLSLKEMLVTPGVYVVTITPKDAEYLLGLNTGNRKKKVAAIRRYADEMRAGRWTLTNQGIGVSRSMTLIDGQNRLHACIEAGVPFQTVLITGLESDSRNVVDVGVKRTPGDVFTMAGFSNATVTAATSALLIRHRELVAAGGPWTTNGGSGWSGQRRNHEALLEFARGHENDLHTAVLAGRYWRLAFPKMPMSTASAFVFLLREVDPGEASLFSQAVQSGAMLAEDDVRLLLRTQLLRLVKAPNAVWQLGMCIKAWNAWRKRETRELLVFKDVEPMPDLV